MNREDQIPIDTMNNSSDESADSPGQNQPISNIESLDRKISAKSSQEPILSIRPADVMCGRTKQSFNHVGNRRFRALTNSALDDYLNADSKWAKSMVASRLVAIIHSEGGRFLKQKRDSGEWYELSPQEAKSKVSHASKWRSTEQKITTLQQLSGLQCYLFSNIFVSFFSPTNFFV